MICSAEHQFELVLYGTKSQKASLIHCESIPEDIVVRPLIVSLCGEAE
jgi:hypothetical protein